MSLLKNPNKTKQYLKYSAGGLEMGLSVVVGLFIGSWLDKKLGTDPYLLFLWLVFGFLAGLRSMIRTMRKALKENDDAPSNE